jgi:hypothetical protein
MQFIQHGPDIPDALLQSHEEGRVVFFCGAGISYPAGLPGFKGLVDEIYRIVGTKQDLLEQQVYLRGQYDATLDLLEHRLPGQRTAVRAALAKVLKPNLRLKGATDTHAALLQLARSREGAVRLVTTNFDRIFQRLMSKAKPAVSGYPAPLLPIPKNSRWNGVVYLHGLLPEKPEESALNRLVLTSGDFGLAYLTERWASRFVSELFRNYVVCFVGYSINDPVLRYMMDALAADRMLGEITPQAYALGDCQSGQEEAKTVEWEAKGVKPILYEVPAGTHNHSSLHRTLKAWAETYRDGIQGKERIVVEYAMTRPSASTQQDNFVGRMLWALSHDSGLPARRFAEFDPVPSLDWLTALGENRYGYSDLARHGVPPLVEPDNKLTFSLISRPAPYTRAPWMNLVSGGAMPSQWDDVMRQLARWLTRHLNDPELVLWLAQRGGELHDSFVQVIEDELDKLARLEQEGNTVELDRIRANAPNSIPHPLMRTLWRLLLTGRVKSTWRDPDLYRWKERLERDGLTVILRLELRNLLAPKIALKKPFHWGKDNTEAGTPESLKQLVDWDLVLAANQVHSWLIDQEQSKNWHEVLLAMADDFQQLLCDALDLLRELGEADDRHDRANWDLPSISTHWQNRGFHEWVTLIELMRDSWVAIYQTDPVRAQYITQGWLAQPYPTFRRLTLFAATHEGAASPGEWVEWLLADGGWWLWSMETKREAMRLFVLQGARLPDAARARLEAGILGGPPREMFRDELEPEKFAQYTDEMVWLSLAKLKSGGCSLGEDAQARLATLSAAHPKWQIAANERDEFSHWMSGTGDPDYEDRREIDQAPRKRQELVVWLERERTEKHFYEDNWRDTCGTRFFVAAYALCDLARKDQWPVGYWRDALQAWSDEKVLHRSWRYVAPLLQAMPDEVLLNIAHSATWWLEAAAKILDRHEPIFLELCRRILEMQHQDGMDTDQPVTRAINHPVGHVTQALLNFWFRQELNDNQGLPDDLKRLFSMLCDTRVVQHRHARVLLASRLIALFRVDQEWTVKFLLPLLDWQASAIEARATWEGFLWSPRLHRPLLAAFKVSFLETARHYSEMGEHGRQYAAFLTYAALDPADTFTAAELYEAISTLPQDGLQKSAQTLVHALEGAGEQREQYWINRIQPFWKMVWPKSRHLASRAIAEPLALLAITARGEFPTALSMIQDWLQPLERPNHVVRVLQQSGLCNRFPTEALKLLDAIIDDQPWAPRELGECLDVIAQAWPEGKLDYRHQRLREYLRKR